MMQRIEVDEVAQTAWAAEVLRFYTEAGLEVVDLAGKMHRLVTVSREAVLCQPFDGQASHYRLFGSGSTTRWPCSNQPSDRLHVRVDGRGQLEVWSGSLPLAKIFDSEASPAEWCSGLIHVDASKVRNLEALLNDDRAQTLRSLDLQDLRPLAGLTERRTLKMKTWRDLEDISLLAGLTRLESLDLSGCEAITDLGALAGLTRLESLNLRRCKAIIALEPLAGLTRLESLDLCGCEAITALEPLAGLTRLESLNLRFCKAITALEPLSGLTRLKSLDLTGCKAITALEPLAGLTQLESLDLDRCEGITDLEPLSGLTRLESLNLFMCKALSELDPLASLTQLAELNLYDTQVRDVRPLASLTGLRSLDLSDCQRVSDIRPLSGLKNLVSLNMRECERLAIVAPLAELPLLTTLDLTSCANIRDADALSGAQSLRKFVYEESATRDSVLLACAVRRSDSDLVERATTAAASFELSKSPGQHARRLVAAVEVLVHQPALDEQVLRDIAAAFKKRGDVPSRTWQAFFSSIVRAADPALRPAFEVALSDLPLAESERVLTPALLALADAPASAKVWALDLAQRALSAVVTSTTHAREVAPAAAVFFHAQCLPVDVDAWLERGSVAQVPAWRDRVLVALLGRALRSGEILEARRLLALLQTPERRDEARGMLVQHLSDRAEFRDAAAELDALVDRALRASVAANALRQAPTWAGEPEAGLSLLLALDGEPDMLAEVLSSMIQQAPDSELVRHLAAVFAPKQGVDLAECLDALLAHSAVAERVKPKQLAALRGRISADATLAHQALVHGTAALLEAEGLVDKDERAEITAAILGLPA